MAVNRWTRLAIAAPVPVFPAPGVDAWGAVQELRGDPRLRLVPSPRHAVVLLVAGTPPSAHDEALRRVHDQLPRPRAVVCWLPPPAGPPVPATHVVDRQTDDVVAGIQEASRCVLSDPSAGQADLLQDVDPNEWRGVGPFGQGGEGMMGGTPYGRPMARTGDDRDGLALDRLRLTLGPYLPQLPPGMSLEVTLQGEVVQQATIDRAAPPAPPTEDRSDGGSSAAAGRLGLQWLTHALHVEGIDSLAARAGSLATGTGAGRDVTRPVDRLIRRVAATGVLAARRGVGSVDGIDVADRWRARLVAIGAALRHGEIMPALVRAPIDDAHLASSLEGMTLGDAVSTLVSVELPASRAAVSA